MLVLKLPLVLDGCQTKCPKLLEHIFKEQLNTSMYFITKPVHSQAQDPLTWDFRLNTGFNQEQVYNELETLDWPSATPNVMNHRYEHDLVKSPCLSAIHNYMTSTEFKQAIVDLLYQNNIYWYWSIDPEDMMRITNTGGVYVLDKPGFTCPRHVDNRSLVATGMLMFGAEDYPEQRTFFYRDNTTQERYWESSSKFEHGWFNANLHNTWHEGYNRSNSRRYAYLFHLALNIY